MSLERPGWGPAEDPQAEDPPCTPCSQALFPISRGFAGGQSLTCQAAAESIGQPEPLSSRETIVLLKEWDKWRASPWELRRSEALSSALSSPIISSGAYTGMGLEPLPLSFRLRSCCCETPTALPDGSEGQTRA